MTRKNLSDLVRKEAQKPEDELEPNVQPEDESPESEEIHNIELNAIASKLKDVLAEAKHKEDALQAEIVQLKSELQEQKTLVATLKTELSQTDKLKEDFIEAKAVILQLSEANQYINDKNDKTGLPTAQIIETFNTNTDIGSWLG
jgi:DNA gyrase/topoisomerase IV subunit A